jgi:hypothetical protein
LKDDKRAIFSAASIFCMPAPKAAEASAEAA